MVRASISKASGDGSGPSSILSQKRQRSGDKGKRLDREDNRLSTTLLDLNILDCPICFEALKIPIFQCDNGHIACSSCCPKLSNKCPVCAFPIGDKRCRAMESVLDSIFIPCQNAKLGCTKKFTYGKESTHDKECTFSPCSCPAQDCDYTASKTRLRLHCPGREQQQRIRSRSPSPPHQAAAVEAARAPFYAAMREILDESGHDLLPHLHPHRPPRTLWFSHDSSVASAVTEIFEKDYQDVIARWKDVREPVLQRWFSTFARKYHWDSGFTERVYQEFCAKVHDRLPDMVHRWKKSWMAKGDAAKPLHFDGRVWDGLVAYWLDSDHQRRSDNSKSARGKSKNSVHRSGRTSYVARGRMLAEDRGESETDLLAVLSYAKRNPDGTFLDDDSEELYNDVNSKLHELTKNDDPESVGSGSSVAVKNKIFLQSAPRRKGKIRGVGSLQSQIDPVSGYVCGSRSSQFQDPNEVAVLKEELTTTKANVAAFEEMFDYLGNSDPKLKEIMSRLRQGQGEGGTSGTGGSDQDGPSVDF